LEILGIGPLELIMVFVLALIFIGPGKMPEVASSLGKMLREFRAASAELTDALGAEIAEVERQKAEAKAAENGASHAEIAATELEVVAQVPIAETISTEYAPAADPPPMYEIALSAPPAQASEMPLVDPTVEGVLATFAARDAEDAASQAAAREEARLAALAAIGMTPLSASLLLPSTSSPLQVVNPTGAGLPREDGGIAASNGRIAGEEAVAPSALEDVVQAPASTAMDEVRAEPQPEGGLEDQQSGPDIPSDGRSDGEATLEASPVGRSEVI
jgi:TatA/E family protein of Tat protein translocase